MDAISDRLGHPHAVTEQGYVDFIDGLRFVAVALVLLFHVGIGQFAGGYVGVDVFFVISGFLITKICIRDRFSYGTFILSRARRIVPAYYVVAAVTAIVSLAVLLPPDLSSSAKALVSIPLFLQNFVFWKQTDYFSPDLVTNPYLHTWSLAVEWQFYLAYPLLVRLIVRSRRRLLIGLLTVFVISLAASVWGAFHKPPATFYLTPFRAWEFIVGGLIASFRIWRFRSQASAAIAMGAGLAAVMLAALTFTAATPFPGATALLPCVGTGLVLAGGLQWPESLFARMLSIGWVRLVGQASYSIYLVHWPLLVFARYFFPIALPLPVALVWLALSIGLGLASWRFVERPFRAKHAPGQRGRIAWLTIAAVIAPLAGGISWGLGGLPQRFSPKVNAVLATANDRGQFRKCLTRDPMKLGTGGLCHLGQSASPPDFVVWGDSAAAALADGLDAQAKGLKRSGILVGTHSCVPVAGVRGGYVPSQELCQRLQEGGPKIVAELRPRTLILHANWLRPWTERGPNFRRAVEASFPKLARLAPTVIVVGIVPAPAMAVPAGMARNLAFGASIDVGPTKSARATYNAIDQFLASEATKNGMRFVSLQAATCAVSCRMTVDGMPAYFDNFHMTASASRRIVKRLGLLD